MIHRQLTLLACTAALAFSQMRNNTPQDFKCQENHSSRNRQSFCEVREQTIPAVQKFTINPGQNGGVSVKGWNRNDVLVRARIQTSAETTDQAKALASQIRLDTSAGRITADGPDSRGRNGWGVSFEIFLPHRTALDVHTSNGGLHFSDIHADVTFKTTNGGVHLTRLAGSVKGATTNGGIHLELTGDRWEGNELNVQTTNGGVHVSMPELYTARFETATTNGRIHIDMPGVSVAKDAREYRSAAGASGPLVRVVTTNGSVHIGRRKPTA